MVEKDFWHPSYDLMIQQLDEHTLGTDLLLWSQVLKDIEVRLSPDDDEFYAPTRESVLSFDHKLFPVYDSQMRAQTFSFDKQGLMLNESKFPIYPNFDESGIESLMINCTQIVTNSPNQVLKSKVTITIEYKRKKPSASGRYMLPLRKPHILDRVLSEGQTFSLSRDLVEPESQLGDRDYILFQLKEINADQGYIIIGPAAR